MTSKIKTLFADFLTSQSFASFKEKKAKNGEVLSEEQQQKNLIAKLLDTAKRRFNKNKLTDAGAISAMWRAGFVEVGKAGLLIEVLKEHLLDTTGEVKMEHLENIVSDFQNRQSQTYCKCGGIVAEHCEVCLECK